MANKLRDERDPEFIRAMKIAETRTLAFVAEEFLNDIRVVHRAVRQNGMNPRTIAFLA